MTPQTIGMLIALPFVGWRLYSRARRSIGRQQSKLWRHWTASILWPLLAVMLAAFLAASPITLGGLVLGVATGMALGNWGLQLTRFEKTPAGAFFTPNPYLGTGLVALFALRIAFRFVQMFGSSAPPPSDPTAGFGNSPLTMVIFGLLAGYYATYAIGLLRWRRRDEGDGDMPTDRG